jgi:chromosome segregation ATPase
MNRSLQYLNLLGVVALAALCVMQWRANRHLNLDVNGLEKARQEQAVRLADQEKTLTGYKADLDGFRGQLSRAAAEAAETGAHLAAAQHQLTQVLAERNQLNASVSNWMAAIEERDKQVKLANERLLKLAAERNEAVQRHNDLAEKYSEAVRQLNEHRGSNSASPN